MRDWLRLIRFPLAATAAWDALACLALALAGGGQGLATYGVSSWALLALTSLLTYAFGMAANDIADRARDRTLAPTRPLPSGAVAVPAAVVLLVLLGLGALALGGGPAGDRRVVAVALALALLYDFLTKRWLVPGVLTMGGVRLANASVGVLPLVLAGAAPAYVLLAPFAIGLYAAGVTLWSTTEETDSETRRLIARLLLIGAFTLAGGLVWVISAVPTLGTFVAAGAVSSLAFARTPRAAPPKRQVLEMLLGLYFLSMCFATAANGGTLVVSLGAIALAMLLIWSSQLLVRALR